MVAIGKRDERRGSFFLFLSVLGKSCKILNVIVAWEYEVKEMQTVWPDYFLLIYCPPIGDIELFSLRYT